MLLRVAAVAVVRGAGLLVVVGVVVLAHPGEFLRTGRELVSVRPAPASAAPVRVLGLALVVVVVRGVVVRVAALLVPPPASERPYTDGAPRAAIGGGVVGVVPLRVVL